MSSDTEGWRQRPLTADTTGAGDPGATRQGAGGDSAALSEGDATAGGFDPVAAYLEQLGPGSRRTMREALTKLAGWASDGRAGPHELPWHLLRIEHTAALRTRLASQLAPATANKHLAALRGVLKQAWRHGDMSAEAYQRAIDLPPVRGASPRKAKRLGAAELHRLAQVCTGDSSPSGARDEALLALLYGANLRRSEAVALDLADYDLSRGVLEIRGPGAALHVGSLRPRRAPARSNAGSRFAEPNPDRSSIRSTRAVESNADASRSKRSTSPVRSARPRRDCRRRAPRTCAARNRRRPLRSRAHRRVRR